MRTLCILLSIQIPEQSVRVISVFIGSNHNYSRIVTRSEIKTTEHVHVRRRILSIRRLECRELYSSRAVQMQHFNLLSNIIIRGKCVVRSQAHAVFVCGANSARQRGLFAIRVSCCWYCVSRVQSTNRSASVRHWRRV